MKKLLLIPGMRYFIPSFYIILGLGLFFQSSPANSATSGTCTVGSSGYTTIQLALDDFGCDTVSIPNGTYRENLTISRAVNLEGTSREDTIIDGQGRGSVITIGAEEDSNTSLDIVIKNLTVQNGYNTRDGGGILNYQGYGSIENVIIQNNESEARGGGMYNERHIINFIDTYFINNTAKGDGGGLYNLNREAELNYVIFYGNESIDGGGGAMVAYEIRYAYNSTFAKNSSKKAGGAIYLVNGPTLVNVTITENFSQSSTLSGGIYVEEGITLINTIIAKNIGGDCYISSGITISYGANIDGDGSCLLTEVDDQPNTDPQLKERKNHSYRPLDRNSPAVDKGIDYYAGFDDQTHKSRPKDGNGDGTAISDIGAVELQFAVSSNIDKGSINVKIGDMLSNLANKNSKAKHKADAENLKAIYVAQ